jgi:hypothetical protein
VKTIHSLCFSLFCVATIQNQGLDDFIKKLSLFLAHSSGNSGQKTTSSDGLLANTVLRVAQGTTWQKTGNRYVYVSLLVKSSGNNHRLLP